MFKLSPHGLSTFRQCRRKYWYRYVDRAHANLHRQWPFLTAGANVHATLKDLLRPSCLDRTFASARSILAEKWATNRQGFADRDEEELYWRRALGQLRWFCAGEEAQARPFEREATYSTYLASDFYLSGRIDRVDADPDGGYRVVDYKTSRTSRGYDETQLLIYVLILSASLHFDVRAAEYLYLNGEGRRGLVPSAADLAAIRADLHETRREIEAESAWRPTPAFLCRWCDFAPLCREGRDAAHSSPEAEAEEEEEV
ncbi:MAG: RecB family exonuclease [Chloroflexota bacterium]